jgi:polypeptide N-acetylgalactosaminyltransferase
MILQNYNTTIFNETSIRLLFSNDSLGLQRARLSGFKLARGEVIVPMDSHMEVQEGWSVVILHAPS